MMGRWAARGLLVRNDDDRAESTTVGHQGIPRVAGYHGHDRRTIWLWEWSSDDRRWGDYRGGGGGGGWSGDDQWWDGGRGGDDRRGGNDGRRGNRDRLRQRAGGNEPSR